ncbi:MAG: hypothetical protein WB643_04580 [Candidatus Bathyarchaeia archaeon]
MAANIQPASQEQEVQFWIEDSPARNVLILGCGFTVAIAWEIGLIVIAVSIAY